MRQSFDSGLTQTTVRTINYILFNFYFVPHVPTGRDPHENFVLELTKFKVICSTIEKRIKNCCPLNIRHIEVLTPVF